MPPTMQNRPHLQCRPDVFSLGAGRLVQLILGSSERSTAGKWCSMSHLASLARRRGPWYPVGWRQSLYDRVS